MKILLTRHGQKDWSVQGKIIPDGMEVLKRFSIENCQVLEYEL